MAQTLAGSVKKDGVRGDVDELADGRVGWLQVPSVLPPERCHLEEGSAGENPPQGGVSVV